MDSFSQLEVAVGIILSENKFLATQRPPGKPMAGYWEFPGGKILQGETPFAALCRELEEELGIKTKKGEFLFSRRHVYAAEGIIVNLHFFIVSQWSNKPQPCESQKIAWVTQEQASAMNFLPADREIVAELKFAL